MIRPSVLFVCTHNSARSQLAEALLRARCGDRYEAFSAGTEQTRVKPEVLTVLAEIGIDASAQRSKSVESFDGRAFDYVVTVCDSAKEACPFVPAVRGRTHAPFADPSDVTGPPDARLDAFRHARERIAEWIERVFGGPEPDFDAGG
jgi:arsenate reductase